MRRPNLNNGGRIGRPVINSMATAAANRSQRWASCGNRINKDIKAPSAILVSVSMMTVTETSMAGTPIGRTIAARSTSTMAFPGTYLPTCETKNARCPA